MYAEGMKGDIFVADVEELQSLDASENLCSKTQRKRSFRAKRTEMNWYSLAQMEQSSCQEMIKYSEHPL